MSATFVENLKQRFAGQMSEGEQQMVARLRNLVRATLDGGGSFASVASLMWSDFAFLRKFKYDVDAAIAAGFEPMAGALVTGKPSMSGAIASNSRINTEPSSPEHKPLSELERTFLEDINGLIDFVTRNGVDFTVVLQVLGHDVGELFHHDFSLEKTLADGVLPKVDGWAKLNVEPVGQVEEVP